MSEREGHWTLGIQVNRKIGDKVYPSLRLYVPSNDDTKLLLKKLQAEGGEDEKLYYSAKVNGSTITLRQVQPQTRPQASRPSLAERADQIMVIIDQLGGTTTWPAVREKLGLPPESTPSPFLVKQLRDRGLLTIKNPKTSTMTWQLIEREKLNGWTSIQTTRHEER
jgi:hypothetical protein